MDIPPGMGAAGGLVDRGLNWLYERVRYGDEFTNLFSDLRRHYRRQPLDETLAALRVDPAFRLVVRAHLDDPARVDRQALSDAVHRHTRDVGGRG